MLTHNDLETHRPHLVRYLQRRGASEEDARDMAQDAIVRVWQYALSRPGHIRADTVGGYLWKCCSRVYANHLRLTNDAMHRGRGTLLSLDALPSVHDTHRCMARRDHHSTNLAQAVRVALSRLSPDHRTIAELSLVEDRSYQEIADALGIPVGTVRSRLSRARAHLRRALTHWKEN